MGRKGMIRTAILLIAAATFVALGVRAQDEPSVADAARRSRQQKQAPAKPSSVITNDTLRPAPHLCRPVRFASRRSGHYH